MTLLLLLLIYCTASKHASVTQVKGKDVNQQESAGAEKHSESSTDTKEKAEKHSDKSDKTHTDDKAKGGKNAADDNKDKGTTSRWGTHSASGTAWTSTIGHSTVEHMEAAEAKKTNVLRKNKGSVESAHAEAAAAKSSQSASSGSHKVVKDKSGAKVESDSSSSSSSNEESESDSSSYEVIKKGSGANYVAKGYEVSWSSSESHSESWSSSSKSVGKKKRMKKRDWVGLGGERSLLTTSGSAVSAPFSIEILLRICFECSI